MVLTNRWWSFSSKKCCYWWWFRFLSNGAIMNIGDSQKFTITHQNSINTITTSANHRLAFGDAGEYISGDGTDLRIVSSGDIDLQQP